MEGSGIATSYAAAESDRSALFRLAIGSLWVGIATALFLTLVWFVSPLTDYPHAFRHTGDYLFTGNGIPFGLAPLTLLWALHRLHGEGGGRKVAAGLAIASVSLILLVAILTGSVIVGQELRWGPAYPLATLGSIVGTALCCAGWARMGLLPRWALWLWAFSWAVGGMLGPKGSQLLLAAAYAVLLVHARRRAREEARLAR